MLADFGVARQLEHSQQIANTVTGSILYSAPEVLQENPQYSKPADIWSLGCVLYELCKLQLPFPDLMSIYEPKNSFELIEECYSKELREIVYQCLSRNAKDRPTVD